MENIETSWSSTNDGRESKQIAVKISWIDNAHIKQPCAFFSHLDFLINSTTVNMLPTKATIAITATTPFTSLFMPHVNFRTLIYSSYNSTDYICTTDKYALGGLIFAVKCLTQVPAAVFMRAHIRCSNKVHLDDTNKLNYFN